MTAARAGALSASIASSCAYTADSLVVSDASGLKTRHHILTEGYFAILGGVGFFLDFSV